MHVTKLFVQVDKTSTFKPGADLDPSTHMGAEYLTLPDGSSVGIVWQKKVAARETLQAQAGIVVLPPLHQAIAQEHVDAFAHAGAAHGDIGYDVAMKLFTKYKMPWMHPENGLDY